MSLTKWEYYYEIHYQVKGLPTTCRGVFSGATKKAAEQKVRDRGHIVLRSKQINTDKQLDFV